MNTNTTKRISAVLFMMWFSQSYAATEGYPLADVRFSQDEASLQRGAIIYYKACRVCHDMKYIRYRNLLDLGFSKAQVDEIRGDRQLNETFSKTIEDHVLAEYYGLVPPDLSLMAKARKNGPRYIYTLMTSYSEKDGVYDNALFNGIRMPDIMNVSTVVDDMEREEINRDIKDVTEFLIWASDPHAAERKKIGFFVVAYFIVLSVLLYMVMKRVWSRLEN